MSDRLEYTLPFHESVNQVVDIVVRAITDDWDAIAKLNESQDTVYLKNRDGVLVHVNEVYVRCFSPDESPIGRSAQQFLEKSIIDVSKHTDTLIMSGSNSLDCEHTGRSADGRMYALRTHKRNLSPLGHPGLAILGITRRVAVLEEGATSPRVDLVHQYHVFQKLDAVDREICRQIGHGVKVKDIAESLNLTSRAVEQRKKKLLEAFGLEQTLDLVKLLVRLQDHGFVDLGL